MYLDWTGKGTTAEGESIKARHWLGAAAAAAAAAAVDAFAIEPGRVDVTRHDLRVAGLPRSLDGLTIAHVTDVCLAIATATSASAASTRMHR